jgi:hypothetical protein
LSVVKKQTFAVADCRAARGIDGAPEGWADTLRLDNNGSLVVAFREVGGPVDVAGTVTYSRQAADRGLIVSRSKAQEHAAAAAR